MIIQIVPALRLPRHLNFFEYLVPKEIENRIKIGQIVEIPFRNRKILGLIIAKQLKKTAIKKLKTINRIIEPEIILPSHLIELAKWMSNYYFTPLSLIIKTLLPEIPKRISILKKKQKCNTSSKPILSKSSLSNQLGVINLLHWQNQKEKIDFYLKIIKKSLSQKGAGILILVPQINNIEVIRPYLEKFFPDQFTILHHQLPKISFWQEWMKIKNGKVKIVLGTRKALFAPFKNLDLIVLEDEESWDYKSKQNPRYDTREVVEKLAQITEAKLILASQAPRVETWYKIQKNKYQLLNLIDAKITKTQKSIIKIIDMNQEFSKGNYSPISDALEEAIKKTLAKKQKILLFLNRRGLATYTICQDCNYLFKCPNCQLALVTTFRSSNLDNKKTGYYFTCYHCNFEEEISLLCPYCQGPNIKFFGFGIQKIEREIKKLFPQAKVLGVEKETAKSQNFKFTNYDIIIGTQFLINQLSNIKSLISKVKLLGIVSIDTLFYRPDFRVLERAFQYLVKIINWAAFEMDINEFICQTFSPLNYAIRIATERDYSKFYEKEIRIRKNFNYPPFVHLIKLTFQNPISQKTDQETKDLILKLKAINYKARTSILGPSLPLASKVRKKFRRQIIVKTEDPRVFFSSLNKSKVIIPLNWIVDVDPESLV